MNYLTDREARNLVESYMNIEGITSSTQEILDSGIVSRLKGYKVYPGKVSDSIFGGRFSYTKDGVTYEYENPPLNLRDETPIRIMVRTARISTHDIVRGNIPFKDQILASNHNYMRKLVMRAIGISQIDINGLDDTSVVIAAENLTQIPFENILRAYMAVTSTKTSLYQAWLRREKKFAGHEMPEGLMPNGPLPYVMDTPSTKSDKDETLSSEKLVSRGICTREQYRRIKSTSLVAFDKVSGFLKQKGIILVDTKTEHGISRKGRIVSQDELYTMDSSRFWLLSDYEEQREKLEREEISELNPRSFSKEFARGFSEGDKGYTDEQRLEIAIRYIRGIEHLLGKKFKPDMRQRDVRVVTGLQKVVEELDLI